MKPNDDLVTSTTSFPRELWKEGLTRFDISLAYFLHSWLSIWVSKGINYQSLALLNECLNFLTTRGSHFMAHVSKNCFPASDSTWNLANVTVSASVRFDIVLQISFNSEFLASSRLLLWWQLFSCGEEKRKESRNLQEMSENPAKKVSIKSHFSSFHFLYLSPKSEASVGKKNAR